MKSGVLVFSTAWLDSASKYLWDINKDATSDSARAAVGEYVLQEINPKGGKDPIINDAWFVRQSTTDERCLVVVKVHRLLKEIEGEGDVKVKAVELFEERFENNYKELKEEECSSLTEDDFRESIFSNMDLSWIKRHLIKIGKSIKDFSIGLSENEIKKRMNKMFIFIKQDRFALCRNIGTEEYKWVNVSEGRSTKEIEELKPENTTIVEIEKAINQSTESFSKEINALIPEKFREANLFTPEVKDSTKIFSNYTVERYREFNSSSTKQNVSSKHIIGVLGLSSPAKLGGREENADRSTYTVWNDEEEEKSDLIKFGA